VAITWTILIGPVREKNHDMWIEPKGKVGTYTIKGQDNFHKIDFAKKKVHSVWMTPVQHFEHLPKIVRMRAGVNGEHEVNIEGWGHSDSGDTVNGVVEWRVNILYENP
jgi:hypothetical protein